MIIANTSLTQSDPRHLLLQSAQTAILGHLAQLPVDPSQRDCHTTTTTSSVLISSRSLSLFSSLLPFPLFFLPFFLPRHLFLFFFLPPPALLPGWTIRQFFHEICPRETEATVKWLLSRGLLRRHVLCSGCGQRACSLEAAEEVVDRLAWICGGPEGCGRIRSVR